MSTSDGAETTALGLVSESINEPSKLDSEVKGCRRKLMPGHKRWHRP